VLAIIGGAIAAAALALVLRSFALAIGLTVSSTDPTWRDARIALMAAILNKWSSTVAA
jgi:hypothetical protein